MSPTTQRPSRSDGDRSRGAILEAAAALATVEGLDGLSLSRLATVTGMSKSGVFGLFGSKEDLQVAVVGHARAVFIHQVVEPALTASPGKSQLIALCNGYLDHVQRRDFPGGCFFASVAAEVGSRPGPLRDLIAAEHDAWIDLLASQARQAIELGELPAWTDPTRLAGEVGVMLTGADIAYLLHDRPAIIDAIRHAIAVRLDQNHGDTRSGG
jgi:AcrR family transcriptional regulator